MRIIAILLTAVLATFGMTACGGGTTQTAPAPTVTVTATPTPEPSLAAPTPTETPDYGDGSVNDVFCETVFQHTDFVNTNEICLSLIKLAHTECKALDNGVPFSTIVTSVLSNYDPKLGWSKSEYATNYGYALGAGVGAYCPQYGDQISGGSTA